MAMSLTLAMAVPCATAALAAGDAPPSNCRMVASMQCLANRPSSLATNGVVCTTFGGVTETPILILRISLQSARPRASPERRPARRSRRRERPSVNDRPDTANGPQEKAVHSGDAKRPYYQSTIADGDAAAGGFDRLRGEFHIDDLIEGRLLGRLRCRRWRRCCRSSIACASGSKPSLTDQTQFLVSTVDGVFDRFAAASRSPA